MRNRISNFFILSGAVLLLVLLFPFKSLSQNKIIYDSSYVASVNDTVQRYLKRHPWIIKPKQNRLKAIPYFGVNYSEEDNFGASIGTIAMYRNGSDTIAPLSLAALVITGTLNNSFYGIGRWMNYSGSGKFLIDFSLDFSDYKRYFWGFGYKNGMNSSNQSTFRETNISTEADILYRLEYINAGGIIGFDYHNAALFSKSELIEGYPLFSRSLKLGLRLDYDTRDDASSPTKGTLIKFRQEFFPRGIFSNESYYKTKITADFFFPVWWGSVFAIDLYGDINYGSSPWFVWPKMGSDTRMRGYYHGRFTDRNLICAQLEIRQKITENHGVAVWGGAGNIFHSFPEMKIKQTLPTYGAGYRLRFAGILFRVDVGFGIAGQYAILAGINQAF